MPRMNLGLPYQLCNRPSCRKQEHLLRCGACKIAAYCGVEHQREDYPRHKSSCALIKTAREDFHREEKKLEEHEEKWLENYVGQFWLYHKTRPFMQARFDLLTTILNIRTGEAVDAALIHNLELLRLCPADNMGARGHLPGLYLRLGRDQECYDLLKWYAVKSHKYKWGGGPEGFLDYKGEDALEAQEKAWEDFGMLSHVVCMCLLKLRLMLDLTTLRTAVKRRGSRETTNEMKMAMLEEDAMSDILLSRPDIVNQDDYTPTIDELMRQVHELYMIVKKRNKFFWPGILYPDQYSMAHPTIYLPGSKEEVHLTFRECWYSWAECEPAITMIRAVIDNGF